ncbi:MAG: T9SS type A sorting domain-containing protein [Cytophagales bacterium]|nr:T9SS type A sorting domain-containing protein [Cytophagales bacterium]
MGTALNVANKTITADGAFNIVQIFTIGRNNARLPVRLVSFSAQQLDGRVQLKWQSASEENTSHFDVERSADGRNFDLLLTKKAQGNSSTLVSYNALDNSPLGGTSYYRLKMADLDGTFEYSSMVSVNAEGTVLVRPYPNPSNGREVQFLALNGDKLVLQSVMDASGKPVGFEASPVSGQGLYVNFYRALPAGFYVATLVTDDKRERVRIKFIVQ